MPTLPHTLPTAFLQIPWVVLKILDEIIWGGHINVLSHVNSKHSPCARLYRCVLQLAQAGDNAEPEPTFVTNS